MRLRLLLLLTLGPLTACSSSDPRALADEGSKSLNSGQFAAAQDSYEQALKALGDDAANPEWMRAKMGLLQARAHLDPKRAESEFLEFAAANPGKVTDKEYSLMGGLLGEANQIDLAIRILKAGIEANPESPHLEALKQELGKKAEKGGSPEALKALEGLGYAGD